MLITAFCTFGIVFPNWQRHLYQKNCENALSCSYSRFSDFFHIIYSVRWKISWDSVFNVSTLFRHKRMFGGGRIFYNLVVYNKCSSRTPHGKKVPVARLEKAESGNRSGGTKIIGKRNRACSFGVNALFPHGGNLQGQLLCPNPAANLAGVRERRSIIE